MVNSRKTTSSRSRYSGRLQKLREIIEQHPIPYLVGGFLSFVATVVTIATLIQLFLYFEDRSEERLQRAWEHLTMRMGGASGKGEALHLLAEQKRSFARIDLSCRNIGAWGADECELRPQFANFSLTVDPRPIGFDRTAPNFADATIMDAEMSFIRFADKFLERARITDSNVSGSDFQGLLNGLVIQRSDMQRASIDLAAFGVIEDSNISNLTIRYKPASQSLELLSKALIQRGQGDGNWYWSDRPPRLVAQGALPVDQPRMTIAEISVTVCDARFRGPERPGLFYQLKRTYFPPSVNLGERRPWLRMDANVHGSEFYRSGGKTYRMKDQKLANSLCPTITHEMAVKVHPEVYGNRK